MVYLLRVPIVERRDDKPCLEASKVMGKQGLAVRHERRHAVAGRKPQLETVAREPGRHSLQLNPGPGAVQGDENRLIRPIAQPVRKQPRKLHRLFQQRSECGIGRRLLCERAPA